MYLFNWLLAIERSNQIHSHNIHLKITGLVRRFLLRRNRSSSKIHCCYTIIQFSSVQSLSRVRLFATPWIAARQASLSITNSRSSLKLTSIKSVMPSSHLILCHPLFLLPPIPDIICNSVNISQNKASFIGFLQGTILHMSGRCFHQSLSFWKRTASAETLSRC